MGKLHAWGLTGLVVAGALMFSVGGSVSGEGRVADALPPEPRESILARAKVWAPTDVSAADLKAGPAEPGAFDLGETVTCSYVNKKLSGLSPKFACLTDGGDELKVKYGGTNGEVYGEVMSSRLLWALGFPADRMYSVKVVCRGCPPQFGGIVRENGDRLLDPVAVERKFGAEISPEWRWDELDLVNDEAGGATVAERDALKLLAVFLQHSDSKRQQQRVVCTDPARVPGGRCERPMMMMNDLGLTWGRANRFNQQPGASVNLAEWKETEIWKGPTGCVGNLAGSFTGTLKDPVISEGGRRFLAELMTQLSDRQLRDMFEAARVHLRTRAPENARSGLASVDEWVEAFKAKRMQIAERRCA